MKSIILMIMSALVMSMLYGCAGRPPGELEINDLPPAGTPNMDYIYRSPSSR